MAHKSHSGYSHKTWLNDILSDEQYDKEYQCVVYKNGRPTVFPDSYKTEYDQIAFDTLSEAGASITKLCKILRITKRTFQNWVKRHPSFKIAVATGGIQGEDAFRDKVMAAAFQPTAKVNNRLIKMIAGNIYGMREDETPTIIINNNPAPDLAQDESAALYADAIGRKDEYDLELKAESIEDVTEQKLLS